MNQQQRAVVQQALDVLKKDVRFYKSEKLAAIDALRQLLEQPVQEHDHALEQALTRLQKRYSELEAKVGAQPEPVQEPDWLDKKAIEPDWSHVWLLIKAASYASSRGHLSGTTNWGAAMSAYLRHETPPAQPADHLRDATEMVDHGDELTIAYLDGVHTGKQTANSDLLKALEELLEVQDEPCRIDHQGYCQSHYLDNVNSHNGCRVANARALVAKVKGGAA